MARSPEDGWGTGLGAVIAKSIYDGKVRERDEIAMEILRRTETLDGPTPSQQSADPGGAPSRSGTGFFITGDGHLITNDHVVRGGRTIRVRTPGGEFSATLVRSDEGNDLALLKVDGTHASLPVRASRTVRLGESVATVGFPNPQLQGFSPKLTRGEISSLAGIQDDPKAFQVSLPVQPGNSGGALVDSNGNVVGVIVARLSQRAALATTGGLAENVNYAIKSSFLLGFLESVPGLAEKVGEGQAGTRAFEDVVADAEKATALILVQ
jgi:S1-C subfamily serine protease